MRKITEIIKPFFAVIFGALIFLFYLNYLSSSKAGILTVGILSVIVAAYYLCFGILDIVLGDKISPKARNIFSIVTVVAFPLFMFVFHLIRVINYTSLLGPTGWIIVILSLIASLGFPCMYLIDSLSKKPIVKNFLLLALALFVLTLLLNILFEFDGDATLLGNINIIGVVIYTLYTLIAFAQLKKVE